MLVSLSSGKYQSRDTNNTFLLYSTGHKPNGGEIDASGQAILPAKQTICYYDKRIKTTHARQLAVADVYYSPIQTFYWYDKPSFSENEPELEFWDKIPTAWDETKVLQGEPGQFITIARRKGKDWFIGTLTHNDARTVKISFDFLPKGKKYIAKIYSDDPSVNTKTKVNVAERKVDASVVLGVTLMASGGQAIWIRPE